MEDWKFIANTRLRSLWLMAKAGGGVVRVPPNVVQDYPGDELALVMTHTDPASGDFVIEAREQ